jgi:hypothetical protein
MRIKSETYVQAIRESGKLISEPIQVGHPTLWVPDQHLEELLLNGLKEIDTRLPQRTRSKLVKQKICEALGYPVPKSFKKTKPRFIGQNFDTYVQTSNNLQVWNAEVSPTQRYVILRASPEGGITSVRVISGAALALLDKTGTLTKKYQASITIGEAKCELVVPGDTKNLAPLLAAGEVDFSTRRPTDEPAVNQLLPLAKLFEKLSPLVGQTFEDAGHGQERLRGGALHELVCKELGYPTFSENGQMPDVLDQLLEVKMQLARTIDLGLVEPDSQLPLTDTRVADGHILRHGDIRYAIFCGKSDGKLVTITNFFLTTGEAFFQKFKRFEGKIVNRKIQIPLPKNFFARPKG